MGNPPHVSARSAGYAITIALVILLGLAVPVTLPDDAADYRDTAVTAAQDSLSAVRTVGLAAEAGLAGKALDPYLSVVLDDSREAVATSVGELTSAQVPDAASQALRDELSPLLVAAVSAVGDAGIAIDASDEEALRRSVDTLTALGDRLADFVKSHR